MDRRTHTSIIVQTCGPCNFRIFKRSGCANVTLDFMTIGECVYFYTGIVRFLLRVSATHRCKAVETPRRDRAEIVRSSYSLRSPACKSLVNRTAPVKFPYEGHAISYGHITRQPHGHGHVYSFKPQFYNIKVGCKGVYITRTWKAK